MTCRAKTVVGVVSLTAAFCSYASAQVVDTWSTFLNQLPEVEEEYDQRMTQTFEVEIPMRRLTPPCEGHVELTYEQFDNIARVRAELVTASCPVRDVEYALVVNSRTADEDVATQRREFVWSADSGEPFPGSDDYPIGSGTDLISVNARQFSCRCANDDDDVPPSQIIQPTIDSAPTASDDAGS